MYDQRQHWTVNVIKDRSVTVTDENRRKVNTNIRMLMMNLKSLNRHYGPQSIDESTYMRTKCGLLRLTTGVSRSNNLYLQGWPCAPIIISPI